MTSFDYVKDFIVTTDTNSNKNIGSQVFTFNSAAVSVPAASFVQRTFTVPLSTDTRFYQIYVNYSFRTGYYSISHFSVVDPLNFDRRYEMQVSSSGDSVSIAVFLVNNGGSSSVFPAFDLNVSRRDFLDEL